MHPMLVEALAEFFNSESNAFQKAGGEKYSCIVSLNSIVPYT